MVVSCFKVFFTLSVHLLYSFATYFEESVSVSLSTRGARLSLLFTAVAMFHGNEAGIVPRFPSNIRCDKFGHFQHGLFNTASYYLNCLAISRLSHSP